MQLTNHEIEEIFKEYSKDLSKIGSTSHRWIDKGCYEDVGTSLRTFIYNGVACYYASRMWIDDPIQNQRLPEFMRKPWGYYPELPPKPPKPAK
jgi:hypothetical protein